LRCQRYAGKQIAAEVGVSPATVSRILRRLGLNRLSALEPAEPLRRYERAHPGELIHIDVKKLGKFNRIGHRITGDRRGQSNTRGVGWECLQLAIHDHSRVAYSEILPDEKRRSSLRFLLNALRFFRNYGVRVYRRDRQWCQVAIAPLRQSAAPAQDQASAHQAPYTQEQCQSRALRANEPA
jgi:hypothetical protein